MKKKVSRRSFVQIASAASLGVASAATAVSANDLVEKKVSQETPATTNNTAIGDIPIASSESNSYLFFIEPEIAFIEAAVDRLIPPDNIGPGALGLDVAYYIDGQLESAYGNGERMYLEGPFGAGTETQGYQLPLRPSEFYRIAIADINNYCSSNFQGKSFAELNIDTQEQVLSGLEKGEIFLTTVPGEVFFGLLLQNTIEGYFSDPVHGGNRDMGSWKMIGFPGARADFRADVGKSEPVIYPPVSLAKLLDRPIALRSEETEK